MSTAKLIYAPEEGETYKFLGETFRPAIAVVAHPDKPARVIFSDGHIEEMVIHKDRTEVFTRGYRFPFD